MTTAQCLKACRKLSKEHGFIVTEQAQLCRHSDGHVTLSTDRRVTVFKYGDVVHLTGEHKTYEAALASVRSYFKTLNTEQP